VTLQFADRSEKTFLGWWQVFGWPQSNDLRNGNLFCALDALERWLTLRLDAGEGITVDIERILLEETPRRSSASFSTSPSIDRRCCRAPRGSANVSEPVLLGQRTRVEQVGYNFIGSNWLAGGEAMFNFARDWTLAPHRQRKFLDVVVELLLADDDVARRLQARLPTWALPEDPKEALEFKLFFAALDRANYQTVIDPATGAETLGFVYPTELRLEVRSWQTDSAPTLVSARAEPVRTAASGAANRSPRMRPRTSSTCSNSVMLERKATMRTRNRSAVSLQPARSSHWAALGCQNPEAQKHALEVVRAGVAAVASTTEEIRERRMGSLRSELEFIAYAVMHLWLADGNGAQDGRPPSCVL
jgi:hypothetical protein